MIPLDVACLDGIRLPLMHVHIKIQHMLLQSPDHLEYQTKKYRKFPMIHEEVLRHCVDDQE